MEVGKQEVNGVSCGSPVVGQESSASLPGTARLAKSGNSERRGRTVSRHQQLLHFAYAALASFTIGMSASASFQSVRNTGTSYGLDSCRSTTSESVWPRIRPSRLPSKDQ